MMDDQLTINDLPVECADEILKWITDREDRIYARFVCKMWCALIDQDCSSERYHIDIERVDQNPLYQDAIIPANSIFNRKLDFSKIVSQFLNSQRKKISFHFEDVDFERSEQFWRKRGKSIIELYFGNHCTNIPLDEIIENCSVLKTLRIKSQFYVRNGKPELEVLLENCISNGKTNFSVHFLYLEFQTIVNVITISQLINRVFLGVQKVFINYDGDLKVKSISTAFENLKFIITISNNEETLIFDPRSTAAESGGKVPVKMTSLTIDIQYTPNLLTTYSSHYPCGLNHLNELHLILEDSDFRLSDLHEFIKKRPSLESVTVYMGANFPTLLAELTTNTAAESSKMNIQRLCLQKSPEYLTSIINDAFLHSFEYLKAVRCGKLLFSDFTKLLHKLPYLEELICSEGIVDVIPAAEQTTISNGSLLKIKMPKIFLLQTIAKYDFGNLKELFLCSDFDNYDDDNDNDDDDDYDYDYDYDYDITKWDVLSPNLDEHLKRVNCPKLEILGLYFDTKEWSISNQDEFTQWMMNILALFPSLTTFQFLSSHVDINIQPNMDGKLEKTDEILKIILAKHRRLRQIGGDWNRHYLNVISPTHVKHRCDYGQSVLYIP